MAEMTKAGWQVKDELIEQPSWGGQYIIDLKGLTDDPQWSGKKVGQSYELASASVLINPDGGAEVPLKDLIARDPAGFLGQKVLDKFGPDLSLLIKLTQAKGNSFQVHLPEGKTLGHWVPKPEAWFYLAPGLYTFGLKPGTDFEAYSRVLHTIDDEMGRLSREVQSGRFTVEDARAQAQQRIQTLDPFAYVNLVEAHTDDVIDLTAGGIHHSWEDDSVRFPNGNLVYEVQVDVPDDKCSMRGFDKGKILDDGSLRPTHVKDYLATIIQDPAHNELSQHIRKPLVMEDANGAKSRKHFPHRAFQHGPPDAYGRLVPTAIFGRRLPSCLRSRRYGNRWWANAFAGPLLRLSGSDGRLHAFRRRQRRRAAEDVFAGVKNPAWKLLLNGSMPRH